MRILVGSLALAATVLTAHTFSAQQPSAPEPIASAACSVTKPNGIVAVPRLSRPEWAGDDNVDVRNSYGTPQLSLGPFGLWPNGTVVFQPGAAGFINADGSLSMKFGWHRGVPGALTISGRRLDALAPPLGAAIPEGYGDLGFQSTSITFPTTGCWEVTGRVGDATLTFVTKVVQVSASAAGPPWPSAFDVVSIKPVPFGRGGPIDARFLPGRFVATNVTLAQLIELSHNVQPHDVVDGPGWIRSDTWDVTATTNGDVPVEIVRMMLSRLLSERFKLDVRMQPVEGTVYTLTASRPRNLMPPAKPDERSHVGLERIDGNGVLSYRYDGRNATMWALTRMLAADLHTIVADQTGLAGNYDFSVHFAYDRAFAGLDPDPNVPTIFTALENQLGLKLTAVKAPVSRFVVRGAEKATEN